MLLAVALSLASVTVYPTITPWAPTTRAEVGRGCYDSLLAVGTDNAPGGSGRATTVVNIWAFLVRGKNGKAISLAWAYKNAVGDYWIQSNMANADKIRRAFPPRLAEDLLRGITDEPRSNPWKMPGLEAYDANFASIGAIRQGCFSADLPAKYY